MDYPPLAVRTFETTVATVLAVAQAIAKKKTRYHVPTSLPTMGGPDPTDVPTDHANVRFSTLRDGTGACDVDLH